MTFKTAKYETTGVTKEWYGRTLHQIRALVDIAAIGLAAGTLGGWIESPSNLSETGAGWVYPSAIVCGTGTIRGGTIMGGTIWGGTIWGGTIWGGTIRGGTIMGGTIEGGTIWGGTIKTDGDHGAFCTVGSEGGTLSWNFSDDGEIIANRGCFKGTLDEFAAAVEKTHGDSQHGQEYRLLIEFIRLRAAPEIEARKLASIADKSSEEAA